MSDNKKNIENILTQSLDTIMSDRFGRYSKYIIQGRALPDVRDGLKPVQRRIIYAMNDLGLFSDKAFKKSARIVGEVIGKYHPHGDSSIYEAMVRMAQDWKMNVPLIEMHGNKGSIDDDPAAAMRYTETRLAKITKKLLDGIKKDTVSFIHNFDDSEREPTVLPGLLPNLLVNGARGIASGYATEMPPHNLGEVLDAIIAKIKSPNIRLETLLQYIKGPDFPTGGEVQGIGGIYEAMERGQGKIVIRSKYNVNTSKENPYIEITEIPYGVVKSKLVRELDEKRINGSVAGIREVRDESDRDGISIMIEVNPGRDPYPILTYLLQKTNMQVYYNYNNVGIVNNAPKLLSLNDLLSTYIEHQKEVQRKSMSFDLERYVKRLEIINGLIKVAKIADDVIDTIRKSEGSKTGVIKTLIEEYDFTELQASAIADLKLYRLSKTDQDIYLNEKIELEAKVSDIKKILGNEKEFNNFMVSILEEFKNEFATERKTLITEEVEKLEVNMEDLIKHEDVWIGVSRQGYIKKFSNRAYEANTMDKYELKEADTVIYLHKINTSDKLLLFTNWGRYVYIPAHKVAEVKFQDIGKHINDFAAIAAGESIIDAISVKDFSLPLNLISVTKNGKIKRTRVSDFDASRISKPLTAMKLEDGDEMISVRISNGFDQVVIITNYGRAVKYSETQIPLQSHKSKGIKSISLAKKSYVVNMVVGRENDVVGIISKRGGSKRIHMSDIIPSSRTTQGKELFLPIKGNPHVVIDARIVHPKTIVTFRDKKQYLNTFDFTNTHITHPTEGFHSLGPSQIIDGRILKFNRIHKETELLKNIENLTPEEQFTKAEEKINKISQLSIDDLLGDLF